MSQHSGVIALGILVVAGLAGYAGFEIGRKSFTAGLCRTLGYGGAAKVIRKKMPDGSMRAEKVYKLANDQRFWNEVKFYEKLSSRRLNLTDTIVKYYRSDTTDAGYGSIELELMPDGTLDKHLDALSLRDVVSIALDIAIGLQCIHELGFVHKDIKLQNILIDSSSTPKRAKISDFSICVEKNTKQTGYQGSDGYLAPECLTGSEIIVTESDDIYSFGVLLMALWKRHTDSGMFGLKRLANDCLSDSIIERPTSSQCVNRLRQLEALFPKKRKREDSSPELFVPRKRGKQSDS